MEFSKNQPTGAATPHTSQKAQIDELFTIPFFGRSAQAAKQDILDSLQLQMLSAEEGSSFAHHYADLFKRVHAKLLCDSLHHENNQAQALLDTLTAYILEQDAPRLKIYVAAALIDTNIPQARQLGIIFWGIKHAPIERQEGTSHISCFEWAGRTAAEDILSALPLDIADILDESSQSLQALLESEFERFLLENSKQGPTEILLYLKGYFEVIHKRGDLNDEIDQQILLDSYEHLFKDLQSWTPSQKINSIFKDPTQRLEAFLDFAYVLSLSSERLRNQDHLASHLEELLNNAQTLFFQEPSSSAIIEYMSTKGETLLAKYQQTPQTAPIYQWVETMKNFSKIATAVPDYAQ
jgi:hypothetical protein